MWGCGGGIGGERKSGWVRVGRGEKGRERRKEK